LRIALGSDHRGYRLKEAVKGLLSELGYEWRDLGCHGTSPVDYPDVALEVAKAVARGDFDHAILICATGIGMSIAANKVPGVRAALCLDPFSAQMAREHNNANILCLGGELIGDGLAREIARTYLSASFQGGRHARRVEKIASIEKREAQG
jgi:ribose 5-phosphate isomerase B